MLLCACVCVAEVLCLEEGVIEGGMEGTGVTNEGEGGPQGREWRADRRCSDTRRLEEPHIFSVIPGGQRYVRAPVCVTTDTHTHKRAHTQKIERKHTQACTEFLTAEFQKTCTFSRYVRVRACSRTHKHGFRPPHPLHMDSVTHAANAD